MAVPMRTVAEHAALVRELIGRTPVELRPLQQARTLVLAVDVTAAVDLPPFANSAMDGFAVRAAEISTAPTELPVSQDIPAGRTDVQPLEPGTAARIMTGAPIPDGADAVVPVEQTTALDGGARVRIHQEVPPNKHVRERGSDVRTGAVVLHAGQVIGPTQIGLLAAMGQSSVAVHRPLRVLVLSTGDELVAPGNPLLPGQIYESNSPMLAAAIAAIGAEPTITHFVSDDVDTFHRTLADAATGMDLVVTSGGVSAGAYEVVKEALSGRGVEFTKVAMQPGMPQGAGVLDIERSESPGVTRIPVVTLPGNPVSSYVSFEVFLRPAMLAAMGHPAPRLPRPARRLPLAGAITSIAGKRQFRRGVVDSAAGTVKPFGGPGSHLLGWLAGADSLLVVPEDVTELPAGAEVEVWDLG